MPVVEVKLVGTLTDDQKRRIAKRITETLTDVAGKPPTATHVIFDEKPRNMWAHGGELFSDKG